MVRNIGIDLDGVIYPWHDMAHSWMQAQGDIPQDLSCYDLFFDPYKHKTEDYWKNVARIPFIYERTGINESTLATLRELDVLYDIHYITSRPKEAELVTKRWMKRNNLPRRDYLIFAKDKVTLARTLNLKYMVEDSPKHIEALNNIMQSYLLEDIKVQLDLLPDLKGSALILDDNSERIYPCRIRPRFTWHGGEAPTSVKVEKRL